MGFKVSKQGGRIKAYKRLEDGSMIIADRFSFAEICALIDARIKIGG